MYWGTVRKWVVTSQAEKGLSFLQARDKETDNDRGREMGRVSQRELQKN